MGYLLLYMTMVLSVESFATDAAIYQLRCFNRREEEEAI
jgi:hypothetical protein